MYLINKNDKIVIDKIYIKYNIKYNIYNLYYSTPYIKCNGISLNLKFKNYIKNNNLYHIIIEDDKTLKSLHNIQTYIQKYVNLFYLLRNTKNIKYIICNNIYNKDLRNKENINIYIKNIKFINYNYVPIINII
jgi:hypothetical protein